MVEEASAYVQASRLKAGASLANVAFSTPRSPEMGEDMRMSFAVTLSVLLALPATAQHIATTPPPYDLDGLTVAQVQSIYDLRKEWCPGQFKRTKTKAASRTTHCIYYVFLGALLKANSGEMDLYNELVAGEFVIAERVDRRKITPIEGMAEKAALMSRINTDAQTRASAFQQASAQQEQARIAREQAAQAQANAQAQAQAQAQGEADRKRQCYLTWGLLNSTVYASQALHNCLLGLPAPPQPTVMPPMPPLPTQTNCYPNGSGITCTTQ